MFSTLIGGILAVILYLYINKRKVSYKIGQKVYYYLQDVNKQYSGRITAKVTCKREEDITDLPSVRRIIPITDRKVKTTEYMMFEVQPILGGEKIFLSETNILKKVGD